MCVFFTIWTWKQVNIFRKWLINHADQSFLWCRPTFEKCRPDFPLKQTNISCDADHADQLFQKWTSTGPECWTCVGSALYHICRAMVGPISQKCRPEFMRSCRPKFPLMRTNFWKMQTRSIFLWSRPKFSWMQNIFLNADQNFLWCRLCRIMQTKIFFDADHADQLLKVQTTQTRISKMQTNIPWCPRPTFKSADQNFFDADNFF